MSSKRYLSPEDIRLCREPDRILHLFRKLNYQVEEQVYPLDKEDIGFTPTDLKTIRNLYLLADHDRQFQILLFELEGMSSARLRSLATNFLKRGGNYLLVATEDYTKLAFVNPRRLSRDGGSLKVKIHKLLVDTGHPTRHDLDLLEGLVRQRDFPNRMGYTTLQP
ncbi:MAG: hypothetical protein ACE5JP_16275 [Candidatus Bipolaricaulia bacterium]